jgi:hypothetical protein
VVSLVDSKVVAGEKRFRIGMNNFTVFVEKVVLRVGNPPYVRADSETWPS